MLRQNADSLELEGTPCPLKCDGQSKIVVRQFSENWAHMRCSNLQCQHQRSIVSRPLNDLLPLDMTPEQRKQRIEELQIERTNEAALVDMQKMMQAMLKTCTLQLPQQQKTSEDPAPVGIEKKQEFAPVPAPVELPNPAKVAVDYDESPAPFVEVSAPIDSVPEDDLIEVRKEIDTTKVRQYGKKKKQVEDIENEEMQTLETVNLNDVEGSSGLSNVNYYAAKPRCILHQVADCNSSNCRRQTQDNLGRMLRSSQGLKSFPPHLYAKVMSKKHGRMDDLSVSSFADLNMYRPGSSMTDVIRKKQPVYFGPPNRRGRRPRNKNDKTDDLSDNRLQLQISMPANMVKGFISSAPNVGNQLLQNHPVRLQLAGSELDKFKRVPHGIGLREQLMGDFSARPIRTRGRPRKEMGYEGNDFEAEDEQNLDTNADNGEENDDNEQIENVTNEENAHEETSRVELSQSSQGNNKRQVAFDPENNSPKRLKVVEDVGEK